jgi:hypothetical protein
MDSKTLANVLYDEIESSGSTQWVDQLKCDAKAAIMAGKGSVGSLTSSSVNGKNFTKTAELNPVQVLEACQIALDMWSDDPKTIGASYADFREIRR